MRRNAPETPPPANRAGGIQPPFGVGRERLKLDLELARGVQRGFLPSGLPEVPGYEFFAYYEPAFEVGGDYYDFIPLHDFIPLPRQRLAVLLGDVAGKGVVAALLMAKLCADARFCMLTEPDPAAAVTKLNALMTRSGIADGFVTLVAAVLDHESHTVTLVNAGHPPPLLYHRATRTVDEATGEEMAGLPIGVLDGFEYASCQVSLEPGDSILAFTDGVTEAMDVNDVQLQTKGVYAAVRGEAYSPQALGSGWSRPSSSSPPAAARTTTLQWYASGGRIRLFLESV